jgi:signal transduction histidine kinase
LKGALSRAGDPNVPETERFDAISQAQAEADHALAMFSALIDIARAESGLSEEIMQETDISGLATEVAELFSPVLEDAGQQLTVLVPQAAVTGRVHPVLLRQAIGNLLHNAAKYAGANARVSLSVEPPKDGFVRIVVADTGPGIPAESRGIVPQRFVKLDPARHSPGSGLGLAIVAACAKLHRGRLLLEDNRPGLRVVLELRVSLSPKST